MKKIIFLFVPALLLLQFGVSYGHKYHLLAPASVVSSQQATARNSSDEVTIVPVAGMSSGGYHGLGCGVGDWFAKNKHWMLLAAGYGGSGILAIGGAWTYIHNRPLASRFLENGEYIAIDSNEDMSSTEELATRYPRTKVDLNAKDLASVTHAGDLQFIGGILTTVGLLGAAVTGLYNAGLLHFGHQGSNVAAQESIKIQGLYSHASNLKVFLIFSIGNTGIYVPISKFLVQFIIHHFSSYLHQQMCTFSSPLHLLFFGKSFGDKTVNC